MVKQGDILKYKDSDNKVKVLGVCGEVYITSSVNCFDRADSISTLEELKKYFIIPEGKWMLKKNEKYWFINSFVVVECSEWLDDAIDKSRFSFCNVFQTKEEAEKALEKVRKALADK